MAKSSNPKKTTTNTIKSAASTAKYVLDEKKTPAVDTKKPVAETKKSPVEMSTPLDEVGLLVLNKLRALELHPNLQADLEWCIGSYRYDGIPSGLKTHIMRSITLFKEEHSRKTRGITEKFIEDLEKALQ